MSLVRFSSRSDVYIYRCDELLCSCCRLVGGHDFPLQPARVLEHLRLHELLGDRVRRAMRKWKRHRASQVLGRSRISGV